MQPTLVSLAAWAYPPPRRNASRSRSIAPADFARGVPFCNSAMSLDPTTKDEEEAPPLSLPGIALKPSFVPVLLLAIAAACHALVLAFRETAGTRRAMTFGAAPLPEFAGAAACKTSATICEREALVGSRSRSRSRRRGVLVREWDGAESESSLSLKHREAGDDLWGKLREDGTLDIAFFGDVPERGSILEENVAVLEPAGVEEPSPDDKFVLLALRDGADVEKGTAVAAAGGGATATPGDDASAVAAVAAAAPAAVLPKEARTLRLLDAADEAWTPAAW